MRLERVGLDLSGLAQFKASDLLGEPAAAEKGVPLSVGLDRIDFDPAQPRRTIQAATIEELAASIREFGVLEPVSLRSNPEAPGRFVVNRGERRVRAARAAGLAAIAAFLDERIDPFAQVAENEQREDMTPFDLAAFIAERERDGLSRAEIARRLGKPRSVVTEIAGLIDASDELRAAFDAGLIKGRRALYRLARAGHEQPQAVTALLASAAAITDEALDVALAPPTFAAPASEAIQSEAAAAPALADRAAAGGRTAVPMRSAQSKPLANAFLVEFNGRRGTLSWAIQPGEHKARVVFEDGKHQVVPLARLTLIAWAAEANEEPS